MAVANWSWLRSCGFFGIVFSALLLLTWSRQYVGERRSHYAAVQRSYLPEGDRQFLDTDTKSPTARALEAAFWAQVRLNGAARGLQLLAVVVILGSAVVAWIWFDPTRLP